MECLCHCGREHEYLYQPPISYVFSICITYAMAWPAPQHPCAQMQHKLPYTINPKELAQKASTAERSELLEQ